MLRSIHTELLSRCSESVLEGHQIQVQDHYVSTEFLEANVALDALASALFHTSPCESSIGAGYVAAKAAPGLNESMTSAANQRPMPLPRQPFTM